MQQFREVSRTRTTYSTETHTSEFILNTLKWEASAAFPGEVLNGGDGVPREQVLQQGSASLNLTCEITYQNYTEVCHY